MLEGRITPDLSTYHLFLHIASRCGVGDVDFRQELLTWGAQKNLLGTSKKIFAKTLAFVEGREPKKLLNITGKEIVDGNMEVVAKSEHANMSSLRYGFGDAGHLCSAIKDPIFTGDSLPETHNTPTSVNFLVPGGFDQVEVVAEVGDNKLALVGGIEGVLRMMEQHQVQPGE